MTLASGVEPLVLADGTVINPTDGTVVVDDKDDLIEIPSVREMQREYAVAKRRLTDLPVPPSKMNTISMVLCYSLMGITDSDIATVLNLDEEQVGRIRMSDSFREIRESVVHNIIESDQESVRSMISQSGVLAASRMVEGLNSTNEATRIHSAKDLLDRGGHRPADVIEHKHKIEGGLRIEYVTKEENDIPTIDITPKEI
tara:strand:+ start:1429 stop:2028 length:600 start_codon:yes stop_codon:yes gene_type:complete